MLYATTATRTPAIKTYEAAPISVRACKPCHDPGALYHFRRNSTGVFHCHMLRKCTEKKKTSSDYRRACAKLYVDTPSIHEGDEETSTMIPQSVVLSLSLKRATHTHTQKTRNEEKRQQTTMPSLSSRPLSPLCRARALGRRQITKKTPHLKE